MIIENICSISTPIVISISSFAGAMIYAGYSIWQKKKSDKSFKFDPKKTLDTSWQSISAGYIAGAAIGCSWEGILIAMVTGIGIDKIANKLTIQNTQVLNVVQRVAELIQSKDKSSKK